MTTMWIRKHRDIIPAVFVSLYELKSDEKPQNLSDEDLARHLNELKYNHSPEDLIIGKRMQSEGSSCAQSLRDQEKVVPMLFNADILADSITGRLEYLRRNSALDSKTGLFYLRIPASESVLHDFFKMFIHKLFYI